MDAGELNPGLCSPLMGDTFSVAGAPAELATLVLERIVEDPPCPGAPRPEPFTLTFVGSSGNHLEQSTYALGHPAIGSVEIFLIPRGPGQDGRHRYDAVFN